MHNIEIESLLANIIFGAVFMALFYHIILYYFSKDKLLIHYLLYLLFTGIYIFYIGGYISIFLGNEVYDYFYRNLSESAQILYLTFYFNFILKSVEVEKQKSKFLYRSWVIIMVILILYALISFLASLKFGFYDDSIAFIGIRIFIFIITFITLVQCYKLRDITFQRIILYGCSIFFIFGIISFVTNLDPKDRFIYPPEWLILGSFIDIIFFSVAMNYRNKKQWETINKTLLDDANAIIEMQNEILEKQVALENERTRIATDMHDDLGSGLTKINYLSQMVLSNPENQENINKISKTSSELVENLSEIIWTMKEDNNSLEDLLTYIKIYALDYFESNKIEIKVKLPDFIPLLVVNGNIRRNIFLCVKEALHNIVKHAKADTVTIEIEIDKFLKITIVDNGIGLENLTRKNGNGIENMKKRIIIIKGTINFETKNGLTIEIAIPTKNLNST